MDFLLCGALELLQVPERGREIVARCRVHGIPICKIVGGVEHGVDIAKFLHPFDRSFGQIDGLLGAEQPIHETFEFLRARPTKALEIIGVRSSGPSQQPEGF